MNPRVRVLSARGRTKIMMDSSRQTKSNRLFHAEGSVEEPLRGLDKNRERWVSREERKEPSGFFPKQDKISRDNLNGDRLRRA